MRCSNSDTCLKLGFMEAVVALCLDWFTVYRAGGQSRPSSDLLSPIRKVTTNSLRPSGMRQYDWYTEGVWIVDSVNPGQTLLGLPTSRVNHYQFHVQFVNGKDY